MDLRVIAVAFVALVGVWCLVVLPAVGLSGTISQEEERREGQKAEGGGQKANEDHEEVMDGR